MKKLFLLIPFTLMSTLPLISSRCVHEETQEEKDKKLAKKYEKEYIDKQKYVFDDFEQFQMKDEYFKEVEVNKNIWRYDNKIKTYGVTSEFIDNFTKWYNDFQHKFNIFKKIMKKYASREIIEYKNSRIQEDPIDLYYVKEIKFDFSRGLNPQLHCIRLFTDEWITKIFRLPNLNLNLSVEFMSWDDLINANIDKTYYSKINITSIFKYIYWPTDKQKIREIFSIPKPYYKNEHFMTYPAGEQIYQGKDDWKPKIKFESFRGLKKGMQINELLNFRYKRSFDYGPSDIDQNYLKEYGNVNTFKFASYRFEIIGYDSEKPFDAPPSKIDKFTLSEHGD